MSAGKHNDTAVMQPTMLETQLDSICLLLGKMRHRVRDVGMLDHLTDTERRELDAALERARAQMNQLEQTIRGSA
jgi:hypothetical protein